MRKSTFEWGRTYGYNLMILLVMLRTQRTDYIYCLDTSRMKNEECPVVDWEQGEGIGQIYFETF